VLTVDSLADAGGDTAAAAASPAAASLNMQHWNEGIASLPFAQPQTAAQPALSLRHTRSQTAALVPTSLSISARGLSGAPSSLSPQSPGSGGSGVRSRAGSISMLPRVRARDETDQLVARLALAAVKETQAFNEPSRRPQPRPLIGVTDQRSPVRSLDNEPIIAVVASADCTTIPATAAATNVTSRTPADVSSCHSDSLSTTLELQPAIDATTAAVAADEAADVATESTTELSEQQDAALDAAQQLLDRAQIAVKEKQQLQDVEAASHARMQQDMTQQQQQQQDGGSCNREAQLNTEELAVSSEREG